RSEPVMLAPWTGPFGGVPPFDQIKVADFPAALARGMALERAEIDAIAANKAPATFDNTIAALERSGRALRRAYAPYGVWSGNLSTPEFQAVETKMEPQLAAHADAILQNADLFRRIEAVYEARETSGLTPEQKRLAWYHWNRFVRAGAKLDPPAKARVAAIN